MIEKIILTSGGACAIDIATAACALMKGAIGL